MGFTTGGGTHGSPLYNSSPQTVADLQAAVDYAALVGNHKVGTTSQRDAASGSEAWDGLFWSDTTDGKTYKRVSGGWVQQLTVANVFRRGTATITTNPNGDFSITFDTEFPTAFGGAVLSDAHTSMSNGPVFFRVNVASSTKALVAGRAWGSGGAVLANYGTRVSYIAWGS